MCGPKPPKDNSAAIARQKEQEREARINTGKERIDDAFSVFTPDYFEGVGNDYKGYYNPQVDEKFTDARKDLKYNLARAGIQDSSAATDKFGDLVDAYGDRRREVADKALEASNNIRGQVEQQKSDLYNQNTASADPSLAAVSAAGAAGSLQSPPAFSPLGDLFSGLVNAGAYANYGQSRGLPAAYRPLFQPSSGGSSGSGYVVGG